MKISLRDFFILSLWGGSLFCGAYVAPHWTILDDMEGPTLKWTITESGIPFGFEYITDIENPSNTVLLIQARGVFEPALEENLAAALPLNTPIEEGETGTIYFRLNHEDLSEYVLGFSDVEITSDGNGGFTAPIDYSDFEGAIRHAQEDVFIDVRDHDIYNQTTSDNGQSYASMNPKTWYDFWFIIYNRVGIDSDEYSIYIRGGIYAKPTLLKVVRNTGTEESPILSYSETSSFRNGTNDSIKNIFIKALPRWCNCSALTNDIFIDDLAQAPGAVVPQPFAEDFYPDINGNVDTGNWLGWLNLKNYPWSYSYTFNSWLWLNEANITTQGTWTYMSK